MDKVTWTVLLVACILFPAYIALVVDKAICEADYRADIRRRFTAIEKQLADKIILPIPVKGGPNGSIHTSGTADSGITSQPGD